MKKSKRVYTFLYEVRMKDGRGVGARKIPMTRAETDKWFADLERWMKKEAKYDNTEQQPV